MWKNKKKKGKNSSRAFLPLQGFWWKKKIVPFLEAILEMRRQKNSPSFLFQAYDWDLTHLFRTIIKSEKIKKQKSIWAKSESAVLVYECAQCIYLELGQFVHCSGSHPLYRASFSNPSIMLTQEISAGHIFSPQLGLKSALYEVLHRTEVVCRLWLCWSSSQENCSE